MNRISITGHLGKNPLLKNFNNDKQVANFSISYNDRYAKDGDQPLWFNVEAWNGLSKPVLRDLAKGDKVLVSGTFKMKYDKDGKGYPTIILSESVEYIKVKSFEQGKKTANLASQQQTNVIQQAPQQQANEFSGFTSYEGDAPQFNNDSDLY